MAYPSSITETPAITDGYVLYPHWMQVLFGQWLHLPILGLFWICFVLIFVAAVALLFRGGRLKLEPDRDTAATLSRMGGIALLVLLPGLDWLWIKAELKTACKHIPGLYFLKEVHADGFLEADGYKPRERLDLAKIQKCRAEENWSDSGHARYPESYPPCYLMGRRR